MILFAILILTAGLFVLDLKLPTGAGEWGLYLIPLLMTFRIRKWWSPLAFAGVCSALLVAGYFLSPQGGMDPNFAATNRAIGLAVVWIVAGLIVQVKGAERALRASESRLRAILEHAPIGIFAKDLAGRYVEFNPQAEIYTKLKREEVIGKKDREVFPDELVHSVSEVDDEVVREGKSVTKELQFRLGDELRTHLMIRFPLLDEDGEVSAVCSFNADITEMKRVERELALSNERFRRVLESDMLGICFWDETGRMYGANNRFLEMTGYTREDVEAGRLDWKKMTPSEYWELDEQGLGAVLTSGICRPFEKEYLRKDGSRIPVLIGAAAVTENRREGVCFVLDITERKRAEEARRQSEERFRIISEQSLVGIYIFQDDRFGYVNPQFAELFGYTTEELLAMPSVYEIVHEEDRALAMENVRRRLAKEVVGVRYQVRGRRKDGETILIEANGFATELNGRTVIVGTVHDVTEREQNQAVLKRTTEQLQTLSRRLLELQESERRHIARELHDEIGQALTALKINLQAVQRMANTTAFSPRLVDSINIVDKTLKQVRNLSLDLRPSMLDDLGLSAALRWYSDQQAQRAGLRIHFAAEPMEERLNSAVETACFRVAQEALTNIVRHAQAENVSVKLEVTGEELRLTITDDGAGFNLEDIRQQVVGDRSLGLLGMEERASLIGGRIELKSEPGAGTEVHAWFPIAHSAAESEKFENV